MNIHHTKIVRKELSLYRSYLALAQECDRQVKLCQSKLLDAATPKSPAIGKISIQNHTPTDSVYNRILSDQADYEGMGEFYRGKIKSIELFIEGFSGQFETILRQHYIEGIPYERLADLLDTSASGLKNAELREFDRLPSEIAKRAGLLS